MLDRNKWQYITQKDNEFLVTFIDTVNDVMTAEKPSMKIKIDKKLTKLNNCGEQSKHISLNSLHIDNIVLKSQTWKHEFS